MTSKKKLRKIRRLVLDPPPFTWANVYVILGDTAGRPNTIAFPIDLSGKSLPMIDLPALGYRVTKLPAPAPGAPDGA